MTPSERLAKEYQIKQDQGTELNRQSI